MKAALSFCVFSLALGLAAMILVQAEIDRLHLSNGREAGLGAAAPLFGVALLALTIAIRRHNQPDAPLESSRFKDLATLLMLSALWPFGILLVWGL